MVHDKIQLAIKELRKLEEELKSVRKDIREEEKIEDEQYLELKKSLKELKAQVKDFEEQQLGELRKTEFYGKLRELQLKTTEDLALAREKIFTLLDQLPLKAFEMDLKDEDTFAKVQALPEMRLFLNGKEIKKAA
jgi:hypothetical protein